MPERVKAGMGVGIAVGMGVLVGIAVPVGAGVGVRIIGGAQFQFVSLRFINKVAAGCF